MEENIKYYTPEIEEFYVRFEYEMKERFTDGTVKTQEEFDSAEWVKSVVDIGDIPYIHRALTGINSQKGIGGIRVKLLDKEDIEDIGFKKSSKNTWYGQDDYYLDKINPDGYYIILSIPTIKNNCMYKICVIRYYDDKEGVQEGAEFYDFDCLFIGKIKNKSELKKLLKQLNIC